jgi:hypothetical protein
MRRKSSQNEKVQPATIAKLAFNTLVIAGFMSLLPNRPFSMYRCLSAPYLQFDKICRWRMYFWPVNHLVQLYICKSHAIYN